VKLGILRGFFGGFGGTAGPSFASLSRSALQFVHKAVSGLAVSRACDISSPQFSHLLPMGIDLSRGSLSDVLDIRFRAIA
jgi:hypothetical protein